ncbi:MAG: sialidase family protein, partial [Chitinophagaceae bacterium]
QYPNGRIFLFYCTGNNTQTNVTNLHGVREIWFTTSTDDGVTWSSPVNITLEVSHPYQPAFNPAYDDTLKWTAYATGPGHALQITEGPHKGRIVVPINHGIFSTKTNYAAFFYSDDHGKTFHLSPDVPIQSDETTASELPGGGVLLNSRDQYDLRHQRILSYDTVENMDSTAQWQSSWNPYLIDPVCEGSMLNYTTDAGKQILLFCNPVSPAYQRAMLGLRQSFDWGETWTQPYIADGGPAAYSDIVALPDDHIGILYEYNNYGAIRFLSVRYNQIPVQ